MERENETTRLAEPDGTMPGVPHVSADFRTLPNDAAGFGKVPNVAERRENHTLTVRETARMFESAGVARTERSVINWCQPNRQGIARLDSYYDPNERKYYITPQSVETAIQEEIQRAKKSAEARTSEPFGSHNETVKHFNHPPRTSATDENKLQELEREIIDLKIANRGKDYLIDQLKSERAGFFEKLLAANQTVGRLETKLHQLESTNPT